MSGNVKTKRVLTEGPLFFKITFFALPIMLTGVLQVLYGIADNVIVGRFSGDPNALASVGTTGSLINLITALVMGIAGGAGVVISQLFGAKNDRDVSRGVHTSMLFSVIGGVFLMLFGLIVSKPALELMGVREELIDGATLYLRIRCIGFIAGSVYNFGASILRSTGDSKTPLFILSATGIINVILNLVFVIGCGMTVDGVATATIISEYLSAITVVLVLMKKKGECYGFSFSKLCFDKRLFFKMLRCGIPAGLQSSLFGVANTVLMGAVNTFSTTTVTAYTIAGNIDGISYVAMNSYSQAAATFAGQNYGARKNDRVNKTFIYSLVQVTLLGVLVGQLLLLFSDPIANFYIDSGDANKDIIISTTHEILGIMLNTYFLCGIMEVFAGTLRGLGYAISPMCISLVCVCFFRLLWATFIFPLEPINTIRGLMLAFPLSWALAILAYIVLLLIAWKRLGIFKKKKQND